MRFDCIMYMELEFSNFNVTTISNPPPPPPHTHTHTLYIYMYVSVCFSPSWETVNPGVYICVYIHTYVCVYSTYVVYWVNSSIEITYFPPPALSHDSFVIDCFCILFSCVECQKVVCFGEGSHHREYSHGLL